MNAKRTVPETDNRPSLRIWYIAETYPPDYGGGAAVYIQDICRFMAERGHDVRVLCVENSGSGPYTLRTDYDGQVRVDRLNLPYFKTQDPDGWQLGLRRWRKHQKQIAKVIGVLLSEWRPDLVHYSTARPLGEECLIAIHKHGVPVVAWLHEAWLICPRLMLLRSPTSEPCSGPSPVRCLECIYSYYDATHLKAALKLPWRVLKLGLLPAYRLWRRREARKCVQGAVAYSKFMMRMHAPHISGEVRYIPLGIDLGGLPVERPQRPRSPIRFGFVAGFQQHKGIWDLLDAAWSLASQGFTFELHIWGPAQEDDQREINARGLKDIVFLRGMYASKEIWQIYSEIDVAIMATTVCEPFGRVPLEAAAVGAPTIAPSVGGIVETVQHGVNGLLYRFRDANDLEQQMRQLIESPDLLDRLVKNLRSIPDTRDRVSDVENFYFSVLGANSHE